MVVWISLLFLTSLYNYIHFETLSVEMQYGGSLVYPNGRSYRELEKLIK